MSVAPNSEDPFPTAATSSAAGRYHHGALREALLAAAEAELVENGIESFSLRAVARRAGVSHAAPAHHFTNVDGLLTALAAVSFRRFDAALRSRSQAAGDDPVERLAAMTNAYIDYASASTAMFDLQFTSSRPDYDDPELLAAAEAAYATLRDAVEALVAGRGYDEARIRAAIATVWSNAHGLASLFARREAPMFAELSAQQRADVYASIARRIALAL